MFGEVLAAYRRRLGMTQEELAERAGVSVRGVRNLESGRVGAPRPPTARLLADAFGLAGPDRDRFLQCALSAGARAGADDPTDGTADAAAATAGPVRPVPAQLPVDAAVFTGREGELAALTEAVAARSGAATPVVISAAGGTGKTWLAVHWAHEHRHRFPDGQLFVDLHGFHPTGEPLTAAEALWGFLDALGVPAPSIPTDRAARVGLYRSLTADRQMIIVLDNARDAGQVVDLLPGSAGCVVLVTSRDQLAGLISSHGARPLPVGVLDEEQSGLLLARRIGAQRCSAEPDAVARIVTACGGLPLALGIVAARVALDPQLDLAVAADEVHDAATRLQVLDSDAGGGLRAVLSCSYSALDDASAEMFRLLGLAPGADISLPAAAATTAMPAAQAAAVLRDLQRQSLVGQPARGRWRMHNLVHLYAAEQAERQLTGPQQQAARQRLVDFYLHTADTADRILFPLRRHTMAEPTSGGTPLALTDPAVAWDWLDAEHHNILAAQALAQQHGWYERVWQIAASLSTLHIRRGHARDDIAVWQAARSAAEAVDELRIQALAQYRLGWAHHRAEDSAVAVGHLERALALAEHAGAPAVQADAHRALAEALDRIDQTRRALEHATRSLHLNQALDHSAGQADAHNIVGLLHTRLAHHEPARRHLDEALQLSRRIGHQIAEAGALDSLGHLAQRTGEPTVAQHHYQLAIKLHHDLGDTYNEATSLHHLGAALAATGDHGHAHRVWLQALQLYRAQHRRVDAERLQQHLDALTDR